MDENDFKPLVELNSEERETFHDLVFKQEVEADEEVVVEVEQVPMISAEELEEIKTAAYDTAYQEGLEQALSNIQGQREHLEQLATLLLAPVAFIDKRIQREIIQFSVWIAKAILKSELSINPQKILRIFNEINEILPNLNQIKTLYLSDADQQVFYQYFEREAHQFSLDRLQVDPALSQGEYRLELNDTEVDASVEARVQELVFNMLDNDKEEDLDE